MLIKNKIKIINENKLNKTTTVKQPIIEEQRLKKKTKKKNIGQPRFIL